MKQTKDIIKQMEKEFDENFPVGKYGITHALSGGIKFFIQVYTRTLLESFGEEIINKLETEIDVVLDSEVVKNANVTRECIDGTFTHTRLKMKEIITSLEK